MKTAEEKANEYLDKISDDSLGSPINAAYNGFIAGYNEAIGNIHDKAQQKQALIDIVRGDEELGLYDE